MIRKLALAAPLLLLPQLASAQTVVYDPQLLAVTQQLLTVSKQQLTVSKQQLAVLNNIQALEQAQLNRPLATAALAFARQQGAAQAQDQAAVGTK